MTEQTPKFCLWEEILESYRKRKELAKVWRAKAEGHQQE